MNNTILGLAFGSDGTGALVMVENDHASESNIRISDTGKVEILHQNNLVIYSGHFDDKTIKKLRSASNIALVALKNGLPVDSKTCDLLE